MSPFPTPSVMRPEESAPWTSEHTGVAVTRMADFALDEALTRALRQAAPALRRRRVTLTVDSRWGPACACGDAQAVEADLRCVLDALAQELADGVLAVRASCTAIQRRWRCTVDLAVAGPAIDGEVVEAVMRRLALEEDVSPGGSLLHRARGHCPRTGAALHLGGLAGHGLCLKFQLMLPMVPSTVAHPEMDAGRTRAWVLDADPCNGPLLAWQLQQLGWVTWQFRTTAQAMRRALALHAAQAGPALVLAVESPEVSLASLVTLATRLPLPTCCVLGILPGEAAWPAVAASGAVQTSLWPFSHADLVAFTARASGLAEADMATTTVPRPLRRTPGTASPPHPDDSPGASTR